MQQSGRWAFVWKLDDEIDLVDARLISFEEIVPLNVDAFLGGSLKSCYQIFPFPFFKEDARMHCNLGLALAAGKKVDEALLSFRESLRLSPNNPGTHLRQRDPKLALVFYRNALRLRPGWPTTVQKLSLLLATSKDDSPCDGEEASRLIAELVSRPILSGTFREVLWWP